jgi:hypothetical protein
MTPAALKSYSHKDLAEMAKQGGVRGWHSMRKDQLVKALLANHSKPASARANKKPVAPVRRSTSAKAPVERQRRSRPPVATRSKAPAPRVIKHLRQIKAKLEHQRNLSNGSDPGRSDGVRKDRIVVMVRDSFWLHAYWELTRHSIERAKAAMGQDWHLSRPFLRVSEVTEGGTMSASERVVQEIEIHGGVSNWYVHVTEPPRSYRLEIGYLGRSGRFFSLARSNVVTTPAPGSSDALDENWADVAQNFDKIYALSGGYSPDGTSTELQELFEERLRRPMGTPMANRYGMGADGMFCPPKDLDFTVDAEMIIFGATRPDARVTMRGEPVRLRPDGTFTVRMSLPNQRQVIPVVAYAASGAEQRTIVLAVERNTKVMEPVVREASD